jgi:hypothetical protein
MIWFLADGRDKTIGKPFWIYKYVPAMERYTINYSNKS